MKILNIHRRTINQSKERIEELFATLSTDHDMMLATEKWSPMVLDKGLQVGSKGGHGPIGYAVKRYIPKELVEFQFSKPKGFIGVHRFEISSLGPNLTELKHVIEMKIARFALLSWPLAIRWLHDAYIEDAFDKVENHFSEQKKRTEWSSWVKILRKLLKSKG